jgi:hypothetical protein
MPLSHIYGEKDTCFLCCWLSNYGECLGSVDQLWIPGLMLLDCGLEAFCRQVFDQRLLLGGQLLGNLDEDADIGVALSLPLQVRDPLSF